MMRVLRRVAIVLVVLASMSVRLHASVELLPIYSTVPLWVAVDLPDVESQFKVPRATTPVVPALACTTTLASPSAASVQSALNAQSATTDPVICVTGNATWSSDISFDNNITNGATLICQAVNCTIGGTASIGVDFVPSTGTKLIRVSGFTFTGANGTAKIWIYGGNDLQKVRVDNNTFTFAGATGGEIAILYGESASAGRMIGVTDHNTANTTNNIMLMKNISGLATWVAGQQGGANAMFFEDNVCSFTNYVDTGSGCIDVWRANSTVARFNTLTNSRIVNHSYCHEGPYNSEIYLNTISNDAFTGAVDFRNIHLQGSGEEIVWGNRVNNASGSAITMQHFRSDSTTFNTEGNCNSLADGTATGTGVNSSNANDGNRAPVGTYRGYPAWHQPGRDGSAVLKPVYMFLNQTAGGTRVDPDVADPNTSWTGLQANCNTTTGLANCHIQKDRDLYYAPTLTLQTSATSPFNGTTGVGMGTLANRPTTCTANAEAADAGNGGVGYWATDQGSWNTSTTNSHGPQVSGADGLLYRCSATNTWTLAYTPYTYPHPLVQ